MIGGGHSRGPIAVQGSLRSPEEHQPAPQRRIEGPCHPRPGPGPAGPPPAKTLAEKDPCVSLPAVDLIVRSGQISNQMPRIWIGETANPGQKQVDHVVSVDRKSVV